MSEEQEKKTYGTIETKDKVHTVTALFRVVKDEREVSLYLTDDGSVAIQTKSWLKQNDRQETVTSHFYTQASFMMLLEASMLACDYFGINIKEACERLHASDDDRINYEYAGRGEAKFFEEVPTE